MSVTKMTSKGQITIPKKVRKALNIKPAQKMIVMVDGEQVILRPLRGNILDLGGSVSIPRKGKAIDFRKVRQEVKKRIARKAGG